MTGFMLGSTRRRDPWVRVVVPERISETVTLANAQILRADLRLKPWKRFDQTTCMSEPFVVLDFRLAGVARKEVSLALNCPEPRLIGQALQKLLSHFDVSGLSCLVGRLVQVLVDKNGQVLAERALFSNDWLARGYLPGKWHCTEFVTLPSGGDGVPSELTSARAGRKVILDLTVHKSRHHMGTVKTATMLTGDGDGIEIFVTIAFPGAGERSFRFKPGSKEKLSALTEKLLAVCQVSAFERLQGRAVCVNYGSMPDGGSRSQFEAAANYFCLQHPLGDAWVESTEFGGRKVD